MENQNPNTNSGQQTINIQVPSADNIASRRPLIPVSFGLAIIFFFFTFCDFKCGGRKIGSVTGINLVTGTELKDRDMFTGRETKGKEIPASMWAIFAFGAAIVGFGAFLIKEKRESIIGTGAGVIGFGSLLILQYVIKDTIENEGKGQLEADLQFPYWGALTALGVAGIISYLRMQKTHKIVVNVSQPTIVTPTEESTPQQQVHSSIPQTDTNSFDTEKWLGNNKKKIIGILSACIMLFGIYYFFLRHEPTSDGKKIASSLCDCYKNQNEEMIESYKKFISDFDSYKFTGRQAAWAKFNEMQQSVTNATQHCLDKNQEKLSDLKGRYITDKDKIEQFEYAFNAQQGLCNSNSNEVSSLYNSASTKINNFIGQTERDQARQDSIASAKAEEERKVRLAQEEIIAAQYQASLGANESKVTGTYFGERKGGQECIKLEANHAFKHFWRCDDARPANIGVWEISGNSITLYLPKKEIEAQVFHDFFANVINKNDYYTSDHHDLKIQFNINSSNKKYLLWNDRIYTMK